SSVPAATMIVAASSRRVRTQRTSGGAATSKGAIETIPAGCAESESTTSTDAIASGVGDSVSRKRTVHASTPRVSSATTGSGRTVIPQAIAPTQNAQTSVQTAIP